MPDRAPVSRSDLVRQLGALGVKRAGVLLVHTSFRTVRPVEGGPEALISALQEALGREGTLVMPSWSGNNDQPFDPRSTESAVNLGVVPQIFWRLPGVRRSNHVHAFSASGPAADFILGDELPLPPHIPESPVGRVHELDGQVLLLGVDHDANTTIHLAELLARVPYRLPKYCTVLRGETPVRIDYRENDHCCERFRLVGEWLGAEGGQSVGPVGHGTGKLVRARSIVRVAEKRLEADPLVFLHPIASRCADCDQARASIGSW